MQSGHTESHIYTHIVKHISCFCFKHPRLSPSPHTHLPLVLIILPFVSLLPWKLTTAADFEKSNSCSFAVHDGLKKVGGDNSFADCDGSAAYNELVLECSAWGLNMEISWRSQQVTSWKVPFSKVRNHWKNDSSKTWLVCEALYDWKCNLAKKRFSKVSWTAGGYMMSQSHPGSEVINKF